MRVAVMGGKLQGVEAAYLAHKAGWHVIVVDKNPEAPAVGLCDSFQQFDMMDKDRLLKLFKKVQFVIPALENQTILDNIYQCAREVGVKVVYDPQAYRLSASKLKSDQLFADIKIAAPKPWPLCGFPITVKPSNASGSKNVCQVKNISEFNELIRRIGNVDEWVKQEFLEGPSYSIEVVGYGGQYQAFQVTELAIDAMYDCKRVLAPAGLSAEKVREFEELALKIAAQIELEGIMDVEVILHENTLKVLEIDARLPSQTLVAVYKSTGVNVLEVLWAGDKASAWKERAPQGVIYEHIKVTEDCLEVCGEHIMTDVGGLYLHEDFFGADEAISNYSEGEQNWVATLIITDEDRDLAWARRCSVIKKIMDKFDILEYRDFTPETSLSIDDFEDYPHIII